MSSQRAFSRIVFSLCVLLVAAGSSWGDEIHLDLPLAQPRFDGLSASVETKDGVVDASLRFQYNPVGTLVCTSDSQFGSAPATCHGTQRTTTTATGPVTNYNLVVKDVPPTRTFQISGRLGTGLATVVYINKKGKTKLLPVPVTETVESPVSASITLSPEVDATASSAAAARSSEAMATTA